MDAAAGTLAPGSKAREGGLVACLSFAALTGAVVSGLGQPIVLEVARERNVSVSAAQWLPIITLLVGVVLTPVVSRISDGRLRRGVLVVAMLVVAAGSLLGAALPSFPALLVARALQGLGYAMIPLTVSIARAQLSGPTMQRTLAVLSTSIAVGVGLGNPVMGLCVMLSGYRAAFGFALLVSVVGAVWVWRRVPPAGQDAHRIRIDLPGAVLLGGGLGAILLVVSRGHAWGWDTWQVAVLGSSGPVLLLAWVLVELRRSDPLVDLRLAFGRGAVGVNLAAILLGLSLFGGVATAILLMQREPSDGLGLGFSVFATGLVMMPMALASLVSPHLARRLGHRTGLRPVLPLGALAVALSFGVLALLHDRTWHFAVMMAVLGVGIGVAYSAMPAVIVAGTPGERTASAIGVNQVLRLLGGSVGIATVTAVLAARNPPGSLQPTEPGYVAAAVVSATFALLAALVGWLLVPAVDLSEETVDASLYPE